MEFEKVAMDCEKSGFLLVDAFGEEIPESSPDSHVGEVESLVDGAVPLTEIGLHDRVERVVLPAIDKILKAPQEFFDFRKRRFRDGFRFAACPPTLGSGVGWWKETGHEGCAGEDDECEGDTRMAIDRSRRSD